MSLAKILVERKQASFLKGFFEELQDFRIPYVLDCYEF